MAKFGGKEYINVISQMLVNQTSSLLVASTLGVGALAIYSRPRSLVRAIATIVHNNAMVIVPMVSALQASGKLEETRRLALSATRYAIFLCLPAALCLTIFGADVVRMWMGESYADGLLIGIFAVSGLMEAMCFPLFRILMGLNCHGRIGLMNFVSGCTSLTLACLLVLFIKADLRWIAASIAIPSMLVNAVFLPAYTARVLQIRFIDLLLQTWTKPVLCCLPAAVFFVAASLTFRESPVDRLVTAGAGGLLTSGWLYWRHAVPVEIKVFILKCTRFFGIRFAGGTR